MYIQKYGLQICCVLTLFCLVSCFNVSRPMQEFLPGTITKMHKNEDNGFLTMILKTEADSLVTALVDIEIQAENPEVTKQLKVGQHIKVKGIIDCPQTSETLLNNKQEDCYISVRQIVILKEKQTVE